jgi:hypothetical protein
MISSIYPTESIPTHEPGKAKVKSLENKNLIAIKWMNADRRGSSNY